jgi:glycosyltransferase involved in cell wall biosynthesis
MVKGAFRTKMERILMISYFAPPILSAESILVGKILPELARHFHIDLVAAGDDVDFRKDEALAELIDAENVEIYRYNNPKPQNKIVRRLYQKGTSIFRDVNEQWMRQVLKRHRLKGPYKLIYSRSMPGISHLVAHAFKQKLKVPWVAQFSDPWAHNPYHRYPLEWMHKVEERNEAKTVRSAEKLVFPTVEIRDLVASHYPDIDVKGKSVILPHYFVERFYRQADGETAREEKERTVISYIGDFYGLRTPEPLLKALAKVKQKAPDVTSRLHLRIAGNVEWRFEPLFEKYGTEFACTVERVGQVPYLQSLEEMKKSDILLLIDAASDVNIFLPSKLIDYFGSRKPILGITSEQGTTASLIRKYGFPVVDPRDPDAIADRLIALVREREKYQNRAVTNDIEMFSAASVADELAQLFEQL